MRPPRTPAAVALESLEDRSVLSGWPLPLPVLGPTPTAAEAVLNVQTPLTTSKVVITVHPVVGVPAAPPALSDLVEGAAGGLGVKVGADVGPLGLSLAVGTPGSAEDAEAGGTSTGRTPGLGGLPPGVGLAVHVEGVGAQAGREVSSPVAGGGTIAFGLTTPPAPLAQAAPLVAVAAEGAVAVVDPPRVGPVAEAAASPDVFEAARAVAPVSPTAGAGVEGSEGVAPAPAEPAAPAAEEVEDEEGLEVVTPVDGLDPQSAGPLSDLFSVRLAGLADAAVNSLDYLEELGSDGAGWYLVAVAVATAATAGEVYRRRRTPPVEDGVPDVCEGPVAV